VGSLPYTIHVGQCILCDDREGFSGGVVYGQFTVHSYQFTEGFYGTGLMCLFSYFCPRQKQTCLYSFFDFYGFCFSAS